MVMPEDTLIIDNQRTRPGCWSVRASTKTWKKPAWRLKPGAEIVTVAIRRTNIGQDKDEPNLLDYISPDRFTILPNTAGCFDADSAVRTCRLARELLNGHDLVKLEVLGDKKTLYPDIPQTLEAAEVLIRDNFKVMVYTNDDPYHGVAV